MASSIIHLAVTAEIARRESFRDAERLLLGSVLPDGGGSRDVSHLKKLLPESGRRIYDADEFRDRFRDLMDSDDLWLGYYLHLVQDILFRRFMYAEHGLDPRAPGFVQRLHADYASTNPRLIRDYRLTPDMVAVCDPGPKLAELGRFDVPEFVERVRSYFKNVEAETVIFTREMADEYIGRAVEMSLAELKSLRTGGPLIRSRDWSWGYGNN